MKTTSPARALIASALMLTLTACGSGDDAASSGTSDGSATPATSTSGAAASSGSGELTQIELEQGIGPVRDLELGAVDPALAATGETAFTTKCSACHRLEDRYVGPRLGTVLARREPEFVMNMMLNANEMVNRHPVVRELLAQFYTPMPVQVTDPDEARAILEYLRSVQIDSTSTSPSGAGGR